MYLVGAAVAVVLVFLVLRAVYNFLKQLDEQHWDGRDE